MQRIQPAPTSLPMQAPGLPAVSLALRSDNFPFDGAVEKPCRQSICVAGHRSVLESQVDADLAFLCRWCLVGKLHGQAQVPVSHRVLREAALMPARDHQKSGSLEETNSLTAKA